MGEPPAGLGTPDADRTRFADRAEPTNLVPSNTARTGENPNKEAAFACAPRLRGLFTAFCLQRVCAFPPPRR